MKKSFMILAIVFGGTIMTAFAPIDMPPLYWDADGDGYHGKRSIANGMNGYQSQIRKGWKTTTLGMDRNDGNAAIH